MYLNIIFVAVYLINLSTGEFSETDSSGNQTSYSINCPPFPNVENGKVLKRESELLNFRITAHIACLVGFDLVGPPKVLCVDGKWKFSVHPQCIARCSEPPFILNGEVQIDGKRDENKMYSKGVVATYSCAERFMLSPPESVYRVCEKGLWTGETASCIPIDCSKPKAIPNGFVGFSNDEVNIYKSGYKVEFFCKPNYFMQGPNIQICQNGLWFPEPGPRCISPEGKFLQVA